MFQRNYSITLIFFALLSSVRPLAQTSQQGLWTIAACLPDQHELGFQPGLAGPLTGVLGNRLLIAGGANFPAAMPWEGGQKKYWKDAYLLERKANGDYHWETSPLDALPESLAYGASVTMDRGIVYIGGENETGISNKAFLLSATASGSISRFDLPNLPIALTNLSATAAGHTIYAAGGETKDSTSARLFCLNLDDPSSGWTELAAMPQPLSHAVLLSPREAAPAFLYLAGGRKKVKAGISPFYARMWRYDLHKNIWEPMADMPFALAAAAGYARSAQELVILGGDRGETFHQVEALLLDIALEKDESRKQALIDQKNGLQKKHPGFSRTILLYDIARNQWTKAGEIPFDAPVTTTAVWWDDALFLPSGEIRAGVRTARVLRYK